jgi:hypothetical protein
MVISSCHLGGKKYQHLPVFHEASPVGNGRYCCAEEWRETSIMTRFRKVAEVIFIGETYCIVITLPFSEALPDLI